MIEYIVYEEDNNYIKVIKDTIYNVMINYDIEYNIKVFNNIKEIIDYKTSNFKVYILNDNLKEVSGLEITKHIRKNDWQSIIILESIYKELKYKIIDEKLYILDVIIKDDKYKDNLQNNIKICIDIYDNTPNTLKYTYKKTIYNIKLQEIICIEKDNDNKRCIIKTSNNYFYIQGSLKNIEDKLDKRFIKCNKKYIININEVYYYNIKENLIALKNDIIISDISRNKKREIINLLNMK